MLNLTAFRKLDAVSIARWLIITELVALLFSTALTNLVELSLFIAFIISPTLRQRLLQAIKQPMVSATLIFYLWIIIASIYGIEAWSASLDSVWGWRKIMLLPLAMAVFDETVWKNKLLFTFINVVGVFALLSYASYFFNFQFRDSYAVGIALRNHATQGIMFSVAAFSIATILTLMPSVLSKLQKYIYLAITVLLISNIIYITPGRSGYLALVVLASVFIVSYIISKKQFIIPAIILVAIPLMLLSSPTVNQRMSQGVNEVSDYQNASSDTSMGMRMLLWKNTTALVKERPLFGYGTGAFEMAYKPTIKNEAEWAHNIVHDPHNQFLKIIAEQGLIGLGIMIAMILSSLYQRTSLVYKTLGVGILLVWCANSLFSSHFSTFSEGRFIFLWCGVILAASVIKSPSNKET